MFVNALSALAVLAALAGVNAQSSTASAAPTSTAGISPCIITCITQAGQANGCSGGIADLSCLCTNTAFQQAALSCLQSSCSAQDVQTAQQLEQAECGAGTSATAISSGSSSSASASSSSNAAVTLFAGPNAGSLVGLGVAALGVLAGAGLVL
ncbi:hypothetical protein BD414DRAFT_516970 [Trametes punicea]|nr:hypothetical protein BD414DRAFT_516970 [Trametes punicea]